MWCAPALLIAHALGQVAPSQACPYQVSLDVPNDHRDQWGVLANAGASLVIVNHPFQSGADYSPGVVPALEVGASRAVSDFGELQLRVRLYDNPFLRPWLYIGYRRYSDEGPVTTVFGIEAVAVTGPDWGFGLHGNFGVEWDPARWWGFNATVGAAAAVGAAFNFSFDLLGGVQFRF
jgi:hypothetical protein